MAFNKSNSKMLTVKIPTQHSFLVTSWTLNICTNVVRPHEFLHRDTQQIYMIWGLTCKGSVQEFLRAHQIERDCAAQGSRRMSWTKPAVDDACNRNSGTCRRRVLEFGTNFGLTKFSCFAPNIIKIDRSYSWTCNFVEFPDAPNVPGTWWCARDIHPSPGKWQDALVYPNIVVVDSLFSCDTIPQLQKVLSLLGNASVIFEMSEWSLFTNTTAFSTLVTPKVKLKIAFQTAVAVNGLKPPTSITEL